MKYAGRIYKISSPSTDKVYIGSTKLSLKDRMNNHYRFKKCSSKQIIDYGNAIIELVEDVYTDDDDLNYALRQRERYYILNTPNTVNKNLPSQFRTEKEYRKNYNEVNKDKIAQYREENKDKIAQYCEENKDKINLWRRQYREENKEKKKEIMREYYLENKEKIKEKNKEYREANKDKVKEYREANKNKMKDYYEANKYEIRQKQREYRRLKKEKREKQTSNKTTIKQVIKKNFIGGE